jgi:hypothetical protein
MEQEGLELEADDKFAQRFPALSQELKSPQTHVKIDGTRTDPENPSTHRQISGKNWQGYDPDVIDFIRRAKSQEEAIEVIDYLLHRGEISKPYATRLIDQLNTEGLKSFGSAKKPGYYFNALDG